MSFGTLKDASELSSFNEYLASRSYVNGYGLSSADLELYSQLKRPIDSTTYPHIARWFKHVFETPEHVIKQLSSSSRSSCSTTSKPVDGSATAVPKRQKKTDSQGSKASSPALQLLEKLQSHGSNNVGGLRDVDSNLRTGHFAYRYTTVLLQLIDAIVSLSSNVGKSSTPQEEDEAEEFSVFFKLVQQEAEKPLSNVTDISRLLLSKDIWFFKNAFVKLLNKYSEWKDDLEPIARDQLLHWPTGDIAVLRRSC